MSKAQMKALKFQQMMQAKFGKEVENQLEADDDQDASAFREDLYYENQKNIKGAGFERQKAPQASGGTAKVTVTNFAYAPKGQARELRRSKKWEQVLPPPDSPIGKRWIKTLRERLFVRLDLDDEDEV